MINGYSWPTTGEVSVLGNTFGETDIYQMRTQIGWVSSSLEQRMNGRYLVEDIVVSGVKKTFGFLYEEPGEEVRSEEHTSELQSRGHLVCRLLLEKKNRRRK